MDMNEYNLTLYNQGRQVPDTAKKAIEAGRLRGFTDINPMWRIKRLTEMFGPCGFGWYYDIVDKRMEHGANGEIAAFVDIILFVKYGDEWSKPIPGTGGSSFVAKEKNGLYTSDECFKMALTDALSVAAKALGVGADVYYEKDRTKYNGTGEPPAKKPTEAEKRMRDEILTRLAGDMNVADATARKYWKKHFADLTEAELSSFIDRMNAGKGD